MRSIIYGITPNLMIWPVAAWASHPGLETHLHNCFFKDQERGEWFNGEEITKWAKDDCPLSEEVLDKYLAARIPFSLTHIIEEFYRATRSKEKRLEYTLFGSVSE